MELERNPVLLDLSFLTEEERRIIENVIKRDEALMNQTKERMKDITQNLEEAQQHQIASGRRADDHCSSCKESLKSTKQASCVVCNQKVCEKCFYSAGDGDGKTANLYCLICFQLSFLQFQYTFLVDTGSHGTGLVKKSLESNINPIKASDEKPSSIITQRHMMMDDKEYTLKYNEIYCESDSTSVCESVIDNNYSTIKPASSLMVSHKANSYEKTKGQVLLGIDLTDEMKLVITVNRIVGLPAADINGFSDPFVKIYLLPDKSGSSKRKTAVKEKTLEPIFNETFTYELHAASDISNRSIWLSVWDHDKLGKNEFLGEICIKLSTVEFSSDDEKWYTLQSQQEVVLDDNDDQIEDESAAVDAEETRESTTIEQDTATAKVLLGIHLNEKDTLLINVREVKGLPAADITGYSDPYVKTYLLPDKNKTTKRKTSVKKKTLNPVYNETLTYKLGNMSDVSNRTIWLTVWDHDKLGRNDFLGQTYIPLSSLDLHDTAERWYSLQDKLESNQQPFDVTNDQAFENTASQNDTETALLIVHSQNVISPLSAGYTPEDENTEPTNASTEVTKESSEATNDKEHSKNETTIIAETELAVVHHELSVHGSKNEEHQEETDYFVQTSTTSDEQELTNSAVAISSISIAEEISTTTHENVSDEGTRYGVTIVDSDSHEKPTEHLPKDDITCGEVSLGVQLIGDMLTITVYEARGLAAADKNDVLNSYVKTYLLPDEGKSSKRKTSVKKKTLNPVYNETLTYELDDISDVSNRTILLTVWDHDKLGRNHFLGGSHIPLFSLDLSDNTQKWYTLENNENVRRGSSASIDNETYKFIKSLPLEETELKLETQHQPLVIKESNSNNVVIEHTESSPSHPTVVMRDNNDDNDKSLKLSSRLSTSTRSIANFREDLMISGEVLIGIYLGKKKTLNIVVNEARDLAPAERNGSSNPYVKTYLLPDENKMSKRKTSIKKKTLNPVFNETLTYKIHDRPVISNCTVWLSVWNNDILGRNDFLGEVYISLSTLNLNNKSQKWYTLQDKQ